MPPYIVPLSVQALEIVRYLLDQVLPAQRYLFAHRSDLSKRISENPLYGALRRMGYAEQLTGHGMRATISRYQPSAHLWGGAQSGRSTAAGQNVQKHLERTVSRGSRVYFPDKADEGAMALDAASWSSRSWMVRPSWNNRSC